MEVYSLRDLKRLEKENKKNWLNDLLFYYMRVAFQISGAPLPAREVRLFKKPAYVWDFVWGRPIKLTLEVQGGIWMRKGAHNTGTGITRDALKNNVATLKGWDCLFYTAEMVKSGMATIQLEKYLMERKRLWAKLTTQD